MSAAVAEECRQLQQLVSKISTANWRRSGWSSARSTASKAGLALEDMKRASPPVSKNPVQPSHSLRHLGGCW